VVEVVGCWHYTTDLLEFTEDSELLKDFLGGRPKTDSSSKGMPSNAVLLLDNNGH